jgi:hypothetical protein
MNGAQTTVVVVAAIFAIAAMKIFRSPLAEAFAERLAGRGGRGAGADGETQHRVEALEARVAELEERLDFAERLLARAKEQVRLPGGAEA